MSEWQGQVNRRILACEAALSASQGPELLPWQRDSQLEAAVLHLATAVVCYRHELAEAYRAPFASPANSWSDLEGSFQSRGQQPVELQELLTLLREGGWLAQLEGACDKLFHPAPASPAVTASQGISLKNETDALRASDVAQWCQSFKSLLERQRQSFQEC